MTILVMIGLCTILMIDLVPGTQVVEAEQNWSQDHQDASKCGYSDEQFEKLSLEWISRFEVDYGNQTQIKTTPVIYEDKVIVTNYNTLRVLELSNGDVLWDLTFGGHLSFTPAVKNDIIVVVSSDAYTYGISMEGKELWKTLTHLGSPTIKDGYVYLGAGRSQYCLDIETGVIISTYMVDEETSSPAIQDHQVVFGTNYNCTFHSLKQDPVSKQFTPDWSFNTTDTYVSASPVLYDGKVFFGSWSELTNDEPYLYSGNVTALTLSGDHLWNLTLTGIPTKPVVANGTVYFAMMDWHDSKRDNLMLYAVNCDNGTIEWTYPCCCLTTPALGENFIFVPLINYRMDILDRETGKLVQSFDDENNGIPICSWSSPSVANGMVIIGGVSDLVIAFSEESEPDTSDSDDQFIAIIIDPIDAVWIVVLSVSAYFSYRGKGNCTDDRSNSSRNGKVHSRSVGGTDGQSQGDRNLLERRQ